MNKVNLFYEKVRQSIEPWYILMTLIGAFNVSLNIMLMPQFIASEYAKGIELIGVAMAAWSGGALLAPLFGRFIGQAKNPKYFIVSLFFINSLLVILMTVTTSYGMLCANMFAQGLIFSIAYSILNLLIVRRFDEPDWHNRTSYLVGSFVLGEVVGFALLGHIEVINTGLYIGAIALFIGGCLSFYIVPKFTKSVPVNRVNSPVKQFFGLMRSRFGLFVIAWGLISFSAQLLFFPFPVLMKEVYQVSPSLGGSVVSVAGIIAFAAYPVIGWATKRFGADVVLFKASFVKFLVFLFLGVLAVGSFDPAAKVIVVCALVMINRFTWPFMMTGSQLMASQLAGAHSKSFALTLYMAIAGLGNMSSGFANTLITRNWGIEWIPVVSTIVMFVALIMLLIPVGFKSLAKDRAIKIVDIRL